MTILLLGSGPGSGAAGGSSLPPTGLTGLIGWWDASVAGSFSLSGSDISSVADQSGNSQTMNWVGSLKPTYHASGFNTSYPYIDFPGSSHAALQCTSFPMGTGNTLTFFYVGTMAGTFTEGFGRFFSYASPGNDDWNVAPSWSVNTNGTPSSTLMQFQRNTTLVSQSGISGGSAGHRMIGTINSSGVMTLYADGVASSTATSSGNWTSAGTLGYGRNGFGNFNYTRLLAAEFGVATGFTSSTDVALLDTYLKNKWGL